MASRILGMGEVMTLIRQAEQACDKNKKKQVGPMMGLPGRRKATKSPKNKRKGTKGGGRPRVGGMPAGMPGGFPGGMPALPPGMDPAALDPNAGFKAPKLDFGKLTKP